MKVMILKIRNRIRDSSNTIKEVGEHMKKVISGEAQRSRALMETKLNSIRVINPSNKTIITEKADNNHIPKKEMQITINNMKMINMASILKRVIKSTNRIPKANHCPIDKYIIKRDTIHNNIMKNQKVRRK